MIDLNNLVGTQWLCINENWDGYGSIFVIETIALENSKDRQLVGKQIHRNGSNRGAWLNAIEDLEDCFVKLKIKGVVGCDECQRRRTEKTHRD